MAATHIRVSCEGFTVVVAIDGDGTITAAAEPADRFLGQSFVDLLRWANKQGGLEWEEA